MQYRKLTELKKLEGNPRIIRDKQFKTLCDSIRDNPKYFEARPVILSDRTGELIIIAGNQRYEAAKVVKLKEIPTFLIKELTEEKEREITIRDNISNGEFDFDALANSWSDLPLVEWGIDLPEDWLNDKEENKEESEFYMLNFKFLKDDAAFVQEKLHRDREENQEELNEHWRERCLLRLLKKMN
jgi:hypothetical protein